MRPDSFSALIRELGVPATAARAAAIRQQVLDMPAPIVTAALGYHHNTTARTRRFTEHPVPVNRHRTTARRAPPRPHTFGLPDAGVNYESAAHDPHPRRATHPTRETCGIHAHIS